MIAAISRWLTERQQRATEKAFQNGYGYAAAKLLQMTPATKDHTLSHLEAAAFGLPQTTRTGKAFDKGVGIALIHWGNKCRY